MDAITRPPGASVQSAFARVAEIRAQATAATMLDPASTAFGRELSARMAAPATTTRSGGATSRDDGSTGLVPPFSGAPNLIGRPYQGTHSLGNWQSDNAIDLAAPVGTPIYAAEDGRIGDQIGPLHSSSSRFAGERLTLEGSGGNAFYYAHLSKLAVTAGQQVTRGQLLGWSGSANGVSHLHLGVRDGDPVAMFTR